MLRLNIKSLISNETTLVCTLLEGAGESPKRYVPQPQFPVVTERAICPMTVTDGEFDPQRKIEENKEETGVKKTGTCT